MPFVVGVHLVWPGDYTFVVAVVVVGGWIIIRGPSKKLGISLPQGNSSPVVVGLLVPVIVSVRIRVFAKRVSRVCARRRNKLYSEAKTPSIGE